jgi:hypothetical protein
MLLKYFKYSVRIWSLLMDFLSMIKAHQIEIIKMIRLYRPEIVICNAIEDRHIDHAKGQ